MCMPTSAWTSWTAHLQVLSVCLSVCLSVFLSSCLPACLSVKGMLQIINDADNGALLPVSCTDQLSGSIQILSSCVETVKPCIHLQDSFLNCKAKKMIQCLRWCGTVQCRTLYSAVQCSAVQCSAVQCGAVQCSAVQCGAVQCSAVQLLPCYHCCFWYVSMLG